MKEVSLDTWEEFEEHVTRLASLRSKRMTSVSTTHHTYVSNYLFRGQSDSEWQLTTTLERFTGKLLTLNKYYRILRATKPQVETFTGKTWEEIENEEQMGSRSFLLSGIPAYEYCVYLRHHGFPSPLLDWTRSPYVAAYFAFQNVCSTATSSSIYAYCEYTEGHKTGSSSRPEITGLGPYVRSHRRHFQQQSQYTICTKHVGSEPCFARHSDVFAANNEEQDELWKFNIPNSERRKILERLEQFNINAFSLFGSEESLMETLSIREIFLE
jgi:FRG domain